MAQPLRSRELDGHLPVGVILDLGPTTSLREGAGGPITATVANSTAGLALTMNNPYTGLHAAGLRYVMLYRYGVHFHNTNQNLLTTLENSTRGRMWAIIQTLGKTVNTPTTNAENGPQTGFLENGSAANDRTTADPVAAATVNPVETHPSLLAYCLSDDTHSVSGAAKAAKNVTFTSAMQDADDYGRPASAMWRNTGYSSIPAADLRLLISYEYPCGRDFSGNDNPEGCFRRSTYQSITGVANADLPDLIRHRVASLPAGARHIWCLQAHRTDYEDEAGTIIPPTYPGPPITTNSSQLRAPTVREMRSMFWIHLAEGSTGLLWFTYTDYDVTGPNQLLVGGDPAMNSVAGELAGRLTPSIRKRLLASTAAGAATAFTASGGGSSGWAVNAANAHVGELTDAEGRKLVVVCSRSLSTASVTISHPSLTGYLRSLETGARYKLGTDAISIPALDGTILEYEPARGRNGRRGVPAWDINLNQTVEAWWGEHWANPASAAYISSANLLLHSNVVSVPAGARLQTYVDAAPDYTTFSLAAGASYAELNLVERSHLHFTSANPASPAKIGRVRQFGSEYAQQYNSDIGAGDFGFVAQLYSGTSGTLTTGGGQSIRNKAQRRFLRNPSQDIVFDQIAFDAPTVDTWNPVAQPIVYYKLWQIGDDNPQTDHFYEGAAYSGRCVKDIVFQRCSFSNYRWGSDNGSQASPAAFAITGNVPTENNTGPVAHPGLISINAGARNIVVRDNTFTFATNVLNAGSPSAVFVDGLQGGVVYNNTGAGKLNSDFAKFLINDDYTADLRLPGVVDLQDKREGRYVVIAANALTPTNQPALFSFSGSRLLVKQNTVNYGTSTVAVFGELSSKACRLATPRGIIYESYDCVIDDNDITANALTAFIEFNVVATYSPGLTYASPVRSKIGRATIKNNTALRTNGVTATTVTRWAVEDAASLAVPGGSGGPALIDVATTYSGNNVADGSGFGV